MRNKIIILALVICLAFLPAFQVQGQIDSTKPEITDMTTGTPSTNQSFTVKAYVTDDVEIEIVRLYVYFKIPGGVNTPEHIIMTGDILSYPGTPPPPGPDFQASLTVPDNAITMYYTITAGDTSDNWNITDVISRDVVDNIIPCAVCPSIIIMETGSMYIFNSTGSGDNVAIVNYTWTFPDGIGLVILHGEAPLFNFTDAGEFSGSLEAKDAYDNPDISYFQITITDAVAPVANPGIVQVEIIGDLVEFDGSDSTDNVGIEEYAWSFYHNGTLVTLSGKNPEFRFWEAREYNVTLTVTDAAGNSDQESYTVHVLYENVIEPDEVPWWSIALMLMIIAVMVTTAFIFKSSKD